jgi:Family of unknown function (DUF5684)
MPSSRLAAPGGEPYGRCTVNASRVSTRRGLDQRPAQLRQVTIAVVLLATLTLACAAPQPVQAASATVPDEADMSALAPADEAANLAENEWLLACGGALTTATCAAAYQKYDVAARGARFDAVLGDVISHLAAGPCQTALVRYRNDQRRAFAGMRTIHESQVAARAGDESGMANAEQTFNEEQTTLVDETNADTDEAQRVCASANAAGRDPAFQTGYMIGTGITVYALYAIVLTSLFAVFPLRRLARINGDPRGWMAWVPLLNLATVMRLARLSPWLALLFLCGAPVMLVIACVRIPKTFSRSIAWAAALLLLPVIGWYLLAYVGRPTAPVATAPNMEAAAW